MLQFLEKKKRLLFLFGIFIAALALLAKDVKARKPDNVFDRLLFGLLATPVKITAFCINKTNQVWEDYFYLVALRQENRILHRALETLEIENQLLREKAAENQNLRELLTFKEKFSYRMIPAEIIGRDPSSWFKTILIDKGTDDGIAQGAGVITPAGIVGRVIDAAASTSKVLLVTDINSSVDAVVKRNRARGIVEGQGENSCRLSYVLKTEDVQPDDVLVSSGINSLFPKGVPIGRVVQVNREVSGFFLAVELKPLVDFSKLDSVLVALKEQEGAPVPMPSSRDADPKSVEGPE
jgi:rod shape-determining protein MreC